MNEEQNNRKMRFTSGRRSNKKKGQIEGQGCGRDSKERKGQFHLTIKPLNYSMV